MNRTALLTGGAGYIGGHIALTLRDAGWQLIVLDDLSTGSRLGVLSDSIFYQGDIGDRALLNSIFAKHEIAVVLHLAAVASVPESVADPVRCDRINRHGARTLINAVRDNNIPYFIFSSTAAVYDENAAPPFAEDAPLRPLSPYAESKLEIEQELAAVEQPKHIILRYFNVGGADTKGRTGNHKQHDTTLIKSALECAAGKRPHLNIYGVDHPTADGTCVRDYIHVSDIAAAHLLALNYLVDGGRSEIFNLGLGRGFSVHEVIAVAKKITGINFATVEAPRRQGDPSLIYANTEKAGRVLGFAPLAENLEKIIADAWAWECR